MQAKWGDRSGERSPYLRASSFVIGVTLDLLT
jgi:hypothetical protein